MPINILIVHMDDTWRILTTGAEQAGKTYCHLASTTKGVTQKNGFVPRQICDWIETATLETARAVAVSEEVSSLSRGQFENNARIEIDKGNLQGDFERSAEGYSSPSIQLAWNIWQKAWASAWELAPMSLRPAAWADSDTIVAMQNSPKGKRCRWPVYTLRDWDSKVGHVPLFLMDQAPCVHTPAPATSTA